MTVPARDIAHDDLGHSYRVLLRMGRTGAIVAITAFSVAMSLGVTVFLLWISGPPGVAIWFWSLLAAVVVPGIVGPLIGLFTMNLLFRLRDAMERLSQLARFDSLTGLQNRGSFLVSAERAITQARHFDVPVSVAMIDIDHFKLVNDVHGHAAGDAVLVDVARGCTETIRTSDLVGRFGGEEFVLLFCDCDAAAATGIVASIRDRLAPGILPAGASAPVRVTISVGIASSSARSADLQALLVRADAQMYRAKQGGRDRIASEPGDVVDAIEDGIGIGSGLDVGRGPLDPIPREGA